jgi:hypothetical protein
MQSPLAIFRQAYFGPIDQYLAWHDGFDFFTDRACLDALAPAEQQQAASELLAAVRVRTADARVLLGLAHLRCAEALPLLHDCLRRGLYSFYALEAIAAISPVGFYPPIVAAQLRARASTEYQLMDLLLGLRTYYTLPQLGPAIPSLIFKLLAHSEYLVRYHALQALRHLYGLVPPPELPDAAQLRADQVFGLICEKGLFTNYAKAQRLLLAELPAATLATYPLTTR